MRCDFCNGSVDKLFLVLCHGFYSGEVNSDNEIWYRIDYQCTVERVLRRQDLGPTGEIVAIKVQINILTHLIKYFKHAYYPNRIHMWLSVVMHLCLQIDFSFSPLSISIPFNWFHNLNFYLYWLRFWIKIYTLNISFLTKHLDRQRFLFVSVCNITDERVHSYECKICILQS